MPSRLRRLCCCAVVSGTLCLAEEAAGLVPNPSFEQGAGACPTGWTLEGPGRWLDGGAADGRRAIAVTGDGTGTSAWRSRPLPLQPGALYQLSFWARSENASGGTPISGAGFCNRDLGPLPATWTHFSSIIATPHELAPASARLRFGQWEVHGTVAFDAVELLPVVALHHRIAGVDLGDGESVRGPDYRFEAPWQSGISHSRPLTRCTADFNSNRWMMGGRQELVHRHQIPVRQPGAVGISAAQVTVTVVWWRSGTLAIEASADGVDWRSMGSLGRVGSTTCTVPQALLPMEALWTRLRTDASASLQVGAYSVHATLPGNPLAATGSTCYLARTGGDARVDMVVESLGDKRPGGDNAALLGLTNLSTQPLALRPTVSVAPPGGAPVVSSLEVSLPPGGVQGVVVPYTLPGAGLDTLTISLGDGVGTTVRTAIPVAELDEVRYGAMLPGSSAAVGLWWASSGWKISRTRPLPSERGAALAVGAARGEAEACQLVLRPVHPLQGLRLVGGALTGPSGATIPATAVEILRVGYVDIVQPTDATGCVASWPDPLPPIRAPLDLEAGRNQPFWIRVTIPRDAQAGPYAGTLALAADGWSASVPLRVEVFDFTLPDRMTCATAFGFDPARVWQYQRVPPAQRRAVLERYWDSFRSHHISPYDPAPLDPLTVTWPALAWHGGVRDASDPHGGTAALRLADDDPTANVSAQYVHPIPLASGSLHLSLWHKALSGHRFTVSLSHQDRTGAWMSGRNLDLTLTGTGAWTRYQTRISAFPPGARTATLSLWAAQWVEDGSTTGTVLYDDLSLQDADGRELIAGGDVEPPRPEQLTPQIDWRSWDAAMERALDVHHFTSFQIQVPGMGGGTFFERRQPELLGFPEGTPEYQAAFASYCRALEGHLRGKGWLDRAFVYWFDEPQPKDYPFVMNGMGKLKQAAPALRRLLTVQVEDELTGGPDLWCPISDRYQHAASEARRRCGEHVWWYVCTGPKAPFCTLFIDHPATELRVWLWQTWQRRIEGILVWDTNYWSSPTAYPDEGHPQDPYADAMSWASGYGLPAGARQAWGNGDGRFLYPPPAAASGTDAVLEGPVDSIRWEMLRDGIEDYEYLALLTRLLAREGARLPAAERARIAALLDVPAAITADATIFTRDPGPIERHRRALAQEIARLSPR